MNLIEAEPTTASATHWLRDRLDSGPVASAALKAEALAAGIGPKPLRLARQALELIVTRSGCGKTMRSTWALPSAGGAAQSPVETVVAELMVNAQSSADQSPVAVVGVELPRVDGHHSTSTLQTPGSTTAPGVARSRAKVPACLAAPKPDAMTNDEAYRLGRRVERFIQRGMDHEAAREVGRILMDRDRRQLLPGADLHEGSCAECQCWEGTTCEPGRNGNAEGPRPPTEVWLCWCARRP